MRRWAGVLAVARTERRRGGRGLLLLAVLFGLVGGVVSGAGGIAERTATAYSRLVDAVALDDARVMVAADQPELAAAVSRMAGVDHVVTAPGWVGQVLGPRVQYLSFAAAADPGSDVVRPVVVAGRAPDPAAPDEVLIGEPLAEQSGLRVGDELPMKLLTLAEFAAFDVGFGEPDGPSVSLRVVGIGRMPAWGGALSQALTTPAFGRRYAAGAPATAVFVRLTDAPGAAAAFDAAFQQAVRTLSPSIAAKYLAPFAELPRAAVDPAIEAAVRTTVASLAIFAVVLGGGGLLVVGQGLLRRHAAGRATQRVESALGMTAAERVAARVVAAGPAALGCGAVAVAGAIAAGWVEPLGSLSRFEPTPGFRGPWALAAVAGVGVALLFLAVAGAAAAAAGRTGHRRARTDRPLGMTWRGRRPALLVGIRLAARGRAGLPGVVPLLASTAAVAGIVGALVFGASLDRLVDEPARYGQAADLTLVDARAADIERLVADPRVAAVDVGFSASVQLAGSTDSSTVGAVAREPRSGTFPSQLVTGREPRTDGEVAIGPHLAAAAGIGVGDVLTVVGRDGGPLALTVTGIEATDPEDRGYLGDGIVLPVRSLQELAIGVPLVSARVLAVPGAADAVAAELGSALEIVRRAVPDEVRTLADLHYLPDVLAAVLGVVAGAAMVHTLLAAARRHAREIAVLAVVGATPGQVRATLAALAAVTVAPALLLGVPIGIGLGRVLWWQVASATGVGTGIVVPVGLLAVIIPAVLLAAVLVATAPALRTERRSTATLLVEA